MRVTGTILTDDGALIGYQFEWGTSACRSANEFVYSLTADPTDPRYSQAHEMISAMARAAMAEQPEPTATVSE